MSSLPAIPAPVQKGLVRFSPARKEKFLEYLAQTGLHCHSANSVGISEVTARVHRKQDPEFELRVQEALSFYRDSLCREATRRAVDGVTDDVYFQGAVVGQRQTYSDRLMELLLKRHIPEFRDHVTADMNVTGGVLVVGGMTKDVDAWAKRFEKGHDEPGHEIVAEQPGA
jgi:hypothetical protein